MIMGGEVYLGDQSTDDSWRIGRELGLQIAAHILSPFGIRPIFDKLAAGTGGNGHTAIDGDNLFIHMTGMSDTAWQKVKDVGAQVSIAFPIEMNMRHGMPPIVRMQMMGLEPSLSSDVEVTMTADFFTQMRVAMNLQRLVVNQMTLDKPNGNQNLPDPRNWELPQTAVTSDDIANFPYWPKPPADIPAPLTARDVLRYATINGAKHLRLDRKVGSLTPGKEADIILLDAQALNVAPVNNVPGAVVSLMDRTNVETVIVAGKVRKWKGRLLDVNLNRLRREIEASRDYLFSAAGVPQDIFGQKPSAP
jgi:predicted amidohydrolase YtcJ